MFRSLWYSGLLVLTLASLALPATAWGQSVTSITANDPVLDVPGEIQIALVADEFTILEVLVQARLATCPERPPGGMELETGAQVVTHPWLPESLGSHLICVWLHEPFIPLTTTASLAVDVRPPHVTASVRRLSSPTSRRVRLRFDVTTEHGLTGTLTAFRGRNGACAEPPASARRIKPFELRTPTVAGRTVWQEEVTLPTWGAWQLCARLTVSPLDPETERIVPTIVATVPLSITLRRPPPPVRFIGSVACRRPYPRVYVLRATAPRLCFMITFTRNLEPGEAITTQFVGPGGARTTRVIRATARTGRNVLTWLERRHYASHQGFWRLRVLSAGKLLRVNRYPIPGIVGTIP